MSGMTKLTIKSFSSLCSITSKILTKIFKMNPIVAFGTLLLVAAVHGGTSPQLKQGGGAWSAPAPTGWSGAGSNTEIGMEGVAEAVGEGEAVAEHDSYVHIVGSPDNPAVLNMNTGSGVGMYQSGSNYQQSIVSNDGSSGGYQGNSASNSAYAYDYMGVDAQGDSIEVVSNGWSATGGVGAVGQADVLEHNTGGSGGGWKGN